jgi:PAS domain S-box-containing protein
MRAFRDRPIRQKLAIMAFATTALALLIAGTGIVVADWILFRQSLRRDLTALTRIVADNSTAALAFNDPEVETETLTALRARPHVIAACVYRNDGSILAEYLRSKPDGCPKPGTETFQFNSADVHVSQPILLHNQRTGILVVSYDLGEIADRIKLYSVMVFGVLIVSSFLALLFSSRLREGIATPVSRLVRATTAVSQTGDYAIRAEKLSGDELGLLVDRFNEMLEGIQTRDKQLMQALGDREAALHEVESERHRFEFLAESVPQKIFTARPSGYTDYLNRQWADFTGLPAETLLGTGWAQFIHPDDLDATVQLWKQSVETGQPFLFEHRFRSAAGKYCWHLTRIHPMRDAGGHISMWIGASTDIHDQKEKEQALRRANDDLQQFAYSASHDLQEPIRNVAVYSEIVMRRYRDKLDSEGRMFLSFLQEGGRRLATLVDDLLAYTRASMVELKVAPVDSAAVLEDSLVSLAEAVRESHAQITHDPLPRILMGEAHLQQVFQNLIGNALKYRNSEPVRIHVSASARGSMWHFSVQDNGIGIDPQYKEKIFGVFKRLHHDQKYAGTGIGLAICQRVVERYGGRIWVESQPGQGSTFFFSVPRDEPGGPRGEAGHPRNEH